ncbi:TSUP family transporter [Polaromonas eurypsychrophila]|uniref:Probable membrane transporter protein n=1 Tax=Polaromonas eurypsychrophila TaxID=1614635 RepID=A0A916SLX8_9BURK|nr:TSUP family transporter [Polaromonas eurypsychrophila]GGB04009.1 membrane protein [Polaromonas eurypsychrophila]
MTLLQIALFLLCVALATCAQSLTGFAFALILLGLAGLLELAPLADLANVATVLGLANALVALRGPGRTLDVPAFRDITLGGVVGIFLGVVLLSWLSSSVTLVLHVMLGLTVIACALVVLMETAALRERSSAPMFRLWGAVSGLLTGLFATGGPPLVYHFYRQPMALKTVRDTLVATLAASSLLRLLMVLPTGQFSGNALKLSLLAAPLVFGLSWWLERHPPGWSRAAVLRLVCALLLLTGAGLIVPAVLQILKP